jgi:hypothetical protein
MKDFEVRSERHHTSLLRIVSSTSQHTGRLRCWSDVLHNTFLSDLRVVLQWAAEVFGSRIRPCIRDTFYGIF